MEAERQPLPVETAKADKALKESRLSLVTFAQVPTVESIQVIRKNETIAKVKAIDATGAGDALNGALAATGMTQLAFCALLSAGVLLSG